MMVGEIMRMESGCIVYSGGSGSGGGGGFGRRPKTTTVVTKLTGLSTIQRRLNGRLEDRASHQLSTINHQPSAASRQPPAINHQP